VAARGLREAELSKILENTYRLVNISLINEIAVVTHELGIDLWDALRCAATKPFGYEAFEPGPGVGGHCIPIDPLYLAHLVKEKLGRELQFVRLADEVNQQMAHVVVDRARALVGDLGQARVLLLGVSYKADVPDTRETPAARICRHLLAAGATVRYVDPHVPEWQVDSTTVPRVSDLEEGIRSSDVVILLQRHRAMPYELLESASVPVLNMRGDLTGRGAERP
jgi:UDP-N-acetyl-D-glucosamine dehydrogenase